MGEGIWYPFPPPAKNPWKAALLQKFHVWPAMSTIPWMRRRRELGDDAGTRACPFRSRGICRLALGLSSYDACQRPPSRPVRSGERVYESWTPTGVSRPPARWYRVLTSGAGLKASGVEGVTTRFEAYDDLSVVALGVAVLLDP